mmetsp:Transcript_24536/g.72714  ORF Transcript_24536/g.72714 Transcript_24536/m.72714 type:complete len:350 (+) Transcript_24536:440-1489(+)
MVQQRHAARAAVDGSRPGQAAGQDASGSGRAGAKRGRVGHTARHEFFVHAGRCGLHASGLVVPHAGSGLCASAGHDDDLDGLAGVPEGSVVCGWMWRRGCCTVGLRGQRRRCQAFLVCADCVLGGRRVLPAVAPSCCADRSACTATVGCATGARPRRHLCSSRSCRPSAGGGAGHHTLRVCPAGLFGVVGKLPRPVHECAPAPGALHAGAADCNALHRRLDRSLEASRRLLLLAFAAATGVADRHLPWCGQHRQARQCADGADYAGGAPDPCMRRDMCGAADAGTDVHTTAARRASAGRSRQADHGCWCISRPRSSRCAAHACDPTLCGHCRDGCGSVEAVGVAVRRSV